MILEIDNLGLSAASSRTANDAEKVSSTSATGNDVSSPYVNSLCSPAMRQAIEDDVCLEETEGVEEDMGEPGDSEGDEGEEA